MRYQGSSKHGLKSNYLRLSWLFSISVAMLMVLVFFHRSPFTHADGAVKR